MRERVLQVASAYSAASADYDEHFRRRVDRAEDEVLYGWLRPHVQGKAVLDLCCGTGALLDHLVPDRYTGLDVSSGMIARAQRKHPGRRFMLTSAERAEIDAARFDAVVCLWAWSYVTAPVPVLARARRWLRDGGVAIIHAYGPRYPQREHYVLNGSSSDLVTTYTADGLRRQAAQAGFSDVDVRGFRYALDSPFERLTPTPALAAGMRLSSALLPADRAGTLVLTARKTLA